MPSKSSAVALPPLTAQVVASVDMLPYMINRLTSRINQLWLQELRPYGLTIPRWQVLSILTVLDGSRIGAIAEMAGAEQAVISRVVDQMERDGLVERMPVAHDSRATEVWISQRGRALYDQLLPAAELQVQRLVQPLTSDQADTLALGLSLILAEIAPLA